MTETLSGGNAEGVAVVIYNMSATTTPTATVKGASYTTSTVHKARRTDDDRLVQACGMGRRQLAYLYEVDPSTPVTCKRCNGLPDNA